MAEGEERWQEAGLAEAGRREEEPWEADTRCSLSSKKSTLPPASDIWPGDTEVADSSTGSSDTASA